MPVLNRVEECANLALKTSALFQCALVQIFNCVLWLQACEHRGGLTEGAALQQSETGPYGRGWPMPLTG